MLFPRDKKNDVIPADNKRESTPKIMESKIAIIGNKDLVDGFAVAGFQTFFPGDKKEEIALALNEVIRNDFSICFILERFALKVKEQIRELSQKTYPAIIILPDYREDFGLAAEFLKEVIVRATGTESIGSAPD